MSPIDDGTNEATAGVAGFSPYGDVGAAMPESYGAGAPILDPIARTITAIPPMVGGLIDAARDTPYGLRREDVTDVPGSSQPSDELAGRAFDTAMGVTGGAGVVPAEANALRTGIGMRGVLAGRDTAAATRMQQFLRLENKGVSPSMNYSMTGWYRGGDGQPRSFMSDQGAKLTPKAIAPEGHAEVPSMVWDSGTPGKGTDPGMPAGFRDAKLGDIWDHPDLYQRYPWLKDITVKRELNPEWGGHWSPSENSIYVANNPNPQAFENVLHHEAVHAIQNYEGFSPGSNKMNYVPSDYSSAKQTFENSENELALRADKLGVGHDLAWIVSNMEKGDVDEHIQPIFDKLSKAGLVEPYRQLKDLKSTLDRVGNEAYQKYIHAHGESEARDAPFIRRNPNAVRQGMIPLHVNPELQPGREIEVRPNTERASGGRVSEQIADQARLVDRRPTEPQKAAGNYRKGHVRIHGMEIAIENPCGSFRSGTGPDGKVWRCRLPAHYGYLKRTEGADGDQVDVFIGPHHKSPLVYVINQRDVHRNGAFDEHKVMLGFSTPAQARRVYQEAFSDGKGRERLGSLHEMTVAELKEWLKNGDTSRPFKRAAGGRIAMADGGTPVTDPDVLAQLNAPSQAPSGGKAVTDPAVLAQLNNPGSSNAGWSSYVPAAISDIPKEVYNFGAQQVGNITQGIQDMRARHVAQAQRDASSSGSFFDPGAFLEQAQDVIDTGKALMSGAALPAAPLVGTARSLIGHPLAAAEHAVGTIINPQVAAHDDPAKMYEQAKQDVDTALSAARPRGFTPRGVMAVPPAVAPEAVANQAAANEFGFRLSRGQATGDLDTIRYEDMAARGAYGPEAQKRAAEFFNQQFQAATAAGHDVGAQLARGVPTTENPAEAATTLQGDVTAQAAQARTVRDQAAQRAQAEADAVRGISADQRRALDESLRGGALPIADPREAGEIVAQNVRDAATANRNEFRGLYREFGQLPGEFRVDAVRGMGTRIRNDLSFRDEPVVVDDQLTPSASKAIQALDEMSTPNIQNRASAFGAPNQDEIAGVNLRGIDQMRKKLVAYYQSARANPTDARAMRSIMDAFDGQIERAITEGLFSGDPRALEALQQARASYARYRQTFGPQRPGDDVGMAMQRIVDRNATPEEVANMVVGSGKIGSAGLPVRIADRLEQVLGADSDGWSSVRQAMWQRASQVRNAAGEIDPQRSASSIFDFTGSSLARRMFTDQERAAMRAHAQGVRDLDRTIEQLPETQAASRSAESYQQTFGGEEHTGGPRGIFTRMVEGNASPDEIANGMFKVIGAGNPGHVLRSLQAIEKIVGPGSDTMGAIRQGVWQKLTQAAAGKDQPGAQKATQAINEFLNGSGRSVAEFLYSPEERALMDRYQKALKLTVIPKYARTNSDTAPALLAAVRKYAGMIGSALGLAAEHGSPTGGLEGYAVGHLIDKGIEKASAVHQARKLNQSLEDVVPAPRKPPGLPRFRQARIIPFALQHAPTRNIGALVAQLQGPASGNAKEKKP